MTDPTRHDGAFDLHPAAPVNVCLAMQREMIAIFEDEDVGEQRRPRAFLLIGSAGMGACMTVSQARQLIFGRT